VEDSVGANDDELASRGVSASEDVSFALAPAAAGNLIALIDLSRRAQYINNYAPANGRDSHQWRKWQYFLICAVTIALCTKSLLAESAFITSAKGTLQQGGALITLPPGMKMIITN